MSSNGDHLNLQDLQIAEPALVVDDDGEARDLVLPDQMLQKENYNPPQSDDDVCIRHCHIFTHLSL